MIFLFLFLSKKKRYNQNLRSSNLQILFYIILIVPIEKSLNNNENRISAWNFIFLKFKLLWKIPRESRRKKYRAQLFK